MSQQNPYSAVSGYEIFYDFRVGLMLTRQSIIPILINIIILDIGSWGGQYNSLLVLKHIIPNDPQLRGVDNIDADIGATRDGVLQQDCVMGVRATDCDIALDVMTDIIFLDDSVAVLDD